MKTIGLTGGIGSGKSTVSRLLEIMNIPVYVADTESKKLVNTSPHIREQLIAVFGSQLYRNGELDKAMLASLIFGNKENLQYANSVIHPAVFDDFRHWAGQYMQSPFAVIESAILFDSGFNKTVDVTVTVSAPLEVRIRRVEQRDNVSRESIEARISSQLPEEERNRLSDYVILNDEVHALLPQVESLLNQIFHLSLQGNF
ncbi:dephospho-CoA kinase [Bacteroidia bacterium]|nr:dephospho-CoA kinase [Bacteroidia bacterium]GHU79353.1 dephospho-CoA kinase [Bacteroidia bacterium]